MKGYSVPVTVGIVLSCAALVVAQSSNASRCFQFTWLGPRYTNESEFLNATCMDATRLSRGVPCVHPLVASYDGSWPDVDYIWRNYPEASCILANNDVCAKFTYSFNGVVENSTYFCTRAVSDLDQAITSGCHEQVNGSYSTRVCFCRSVPGGVPCNSGIIPTINYVTVVLFAIVLILQINFVNKS